MDYEGYHQFDLDGALMGSFEVFFYDANPGPGPQSYLSDSEGKPCETGFYWWSCFPGCLPDSEAVGPFDTAKEAYEDAQNC